MGDLGGFYQAIDIAIFLIAEYFSAKFFLNSISNKLYVRKKTPAEIHNDDQNSRKKKPQKKYKSETEENDTSDVS